MFVSHAQNFEDVVLWRAFRDVECGRYIDIGAHDPAIDSVSLAFYEAGWRGMHVEPIPRYAARLREARPDEAVIEAAVTDASGPILFYELDGLSSGSQRVAEHHARAGHIARQMFVPTVRLDHLLEVAGSTIHWVKIDVEGMEADVLRSWGESPVRPWALIIESTFPNTQEPQEHLWIDLVTERGYEEVFFDGLSRYFLHRDQGDRACSFAAPANVFDRFAVTSRHFSAANVAAELHARDEEVAEHKDRAGQLVAELEEARRSFAETSARIGPLQEELDSARSATSKLEADRNELRIEIATSQERITQLEDRLDRADRAACDAKDRLAAVDGELMQARAGATLVEEERNALKIELARVEERSAQLQDKVDRADRAFREAESRRAALQDALADTRAVATRLELERDRARSDREAVEAQGREIRAGLEADVAELRSALHEGTALARAAVDEPVGRWRRIQQSLGIERARPRWSALRAWVDTRAHDTRGTGSPMNTSAPLSGRNPYMRANSLAELVSWDDLDFVRCAYVTILGRQPDPEGESYYSERLRRGRSKMDVLWQLRHSAEAPSHDPGIAGLDRALRKARARTWLPRAIGRLVGSRPAATASPSASAQRLPPPPSIDANRVEELARETEALRADFNALKGVVEGLAHAVRGMADAQVRHESQIGEMRSAARGKTPASAKK